MSRLDVNAIRHTAGSSDNISLDSAGRVFIGASSSTANTAGDDLQIVGSSDRGLTITSGTSSSANIYLGDDGDTDRCRIAYQNNDDALDFSVNGNSTAVRIDSSANLRFNSGYGSVATAYGVRAWINFDGSASTIGDGRASQNMDDVTDNGVGDYTLNFTTDMPDANYCVLGTGSGNANHNSQALSIKYNTAPTASAVRIFTAVTGSANVVGFKLDSAYNCVAIVR